MKNFTYYTPTKVIFGKGAEEQVGALIQAQSCQKVLVHYGSGSVQRSGLLDKIYDSLNAAGIAYVSLGGVVPNPRLSKVYEGIELAKKEGVDFILAVGGGSTIDSAKAIGYGLANDGDVWDFYARTRQPVGCTPVGTVLPLAAAGSEMSNSSVITKEEGWLKRSCNTDFGRCQFAIMNPELTYTLPAYQSACGATDIMMHTMERYFVTHQTMEITDNLSEALLRTVKNNALTAINNPTDYNARAEIMWAGSLAHNDLTGCGADGGDWATHQLEHELGGLYDVAHGAGLAAVWGSWARYVYKEKPARFARFATNVMGVADQGDDDKTALAGIAAVEDFYRSIQMPTNLRELGVTVTDEDIVEMAQKASANGTQTLGAFKALAQSDMEAIFHMAK